MSLLIILIIGFLSGSLIKFTDDISDKSIAVHPFFSMPSGLAYGLLIGYLVSDLLTDEYVLEMFVREIKDNEKFSIIVEKLLTKEGKDLSTWDISYLLKKIVG